MKKRMEYFVEVLETDGSVGESRGPLAVAECNAAEVELVEEHGRDLVRVREWTKDEAAEWRAQREGEE